MSVRSLVHSAAVVLFGVAIVVVLSGNAERTAAQTVNNSLFAGEVAPGEVRSQVEVEGSPELVWSVLTDLASYPVWNPFLYPVEGELRPGHALQVTMHPGRQSVTYQATVLAVERNRLLSWSGQVLSSGVFDAIYTFSIEPAAGGRVRLLARETRKGLAPVVDWLLGTEIQSGLDAMTRSARNRVDLLRTMGRPWWTPTSYSTK